MLVLTNLNLNKNQLLNATLQKLAIEPASPVSGQVYFNTTSSRAFVWTGTEWAGMDSTGATMTAQSIVQAINGSTFLIDNDNLSAEVNDAIAKAHDTHSIADITGLEGELDSKETPTGASAKASNAEDNAKSYTDTKLSDLIGSAPEALDTLYELAQALGEDPNFATTIIDRLADKTKKYSESVGNGNGTSFVINHELNTRDVNVLIRQTSSPYAQVFTDVEMTSVDTITVNFAEPPMSEEYTVTIIG